MIRKLIFKQQKYGQTIVLISAWLLGNIWTYQWFIQSFSDTSDLNLLLLTIGLIAILVQLIRKDFFIGLWTNSKMIRELASRIFLND